MFNFLHLAGRQIAPNAQATLAAFRAQMLGELVVLHTRNERESSTPARQFSHIARGLGEDAELSCRLVKVEETAQSVHAAAVRLLAEPSAHRWVLHATGGNKPMSAGLMMLAAHPRVAGVIYRDLELGWSLFRLDAQGAPISEPLSEQHPQFGFLFEPQSALQGWPLEQLLMCQLGEPNWRLTANTLPSDIQVDQWLVHGCQGSGGRFRTYGPFAKGHTHLPPEGMAFEAMVGLMLKAAGCPQVLWSAEVQDQAGSPQFETDLLACHRDQIVLYNIKLSNDAAKTAQVREAAQTAQRLGGLSARAVLLRPNWPDSASVAQFAQSQRVTLLRRKEVGRMLDALVAPLGLSLPKQPPIERLRETLRQHAARCGEVAWAHEPTPPSKPKARPSKPKAR
jgi:hypothetical protein